MPKLIQTSFAKGEISPELFGRTDVDAYGAGLAQARNAIVHTYGGISRRHGLRWLGPIGDHDNVPRLIPFEFKVEDQYILEFGDLYMRVIRNNAHVTNTPVSVASVNAAQRRITTTAAHGLNSGDEIYIDGVTPRLNGNRYKVSFVNGTTVTLHPQHDIGGTLSTSLFSGFTSGTIAEIYQLTTPYTIDEVWEMNYVQNADVITIVHKDHNIFELSRLDHNDWSLDRVSFNNTTSAPTALDVTVNDAGTDTVVYKVTSVNPETGEESLPGIAAAKTIVSMTNADPGVFTVTSHGYEDYDEVYFLINNNIDELAGERYIITGATTHTFKLTDSDGEEVDTTNWDAFTAGSVAATFFRITNSNTSAPDNTITWTPAYNGAKHNVYRYKGGVFGFIGESYSASFDDENFDPVTNDTPPVERNPFVLGSTTPGAVGYYEQRRVFGGFEDKPDTSEFSQTGRQSNFGKHDPLQIDDAITATLVADQVNEIRHYVPIRNLLVFTSGAEWMIGSGQDSAFGPDTIRQAVQSSWGCSRIKPIKVNNTALFVTRDQKSVRSLGYSFEIDGYTGANLNTFSKHLLYNYTITDWCHQRHPDSRINMIRSDGKALTLSFDQEQELVGWTTMDTQGSFEACACLKATADEPDTVYFVVKRLVGGVYVRYIETMQQQVIADIKDCFYVDAGLSYDVPLVVNSMSLGNPVRLNVTAHGLVAGDEIDLSDCIWEPASDGKGDYIQFQQLNNKRFVVRNVESANVFSIEDENGDPINGTLYNYPYVSGGVVRKVITTVSGLDHLEGRAVVALADGSVVTDLEVSNGSITLPNGASRVHIGLSYVSDFTTLRPVADSKIIQGLIRRNVRVTLKLYNTRSVWVGQTLSEMVELKLRDAEAYGDPIRLFTGEKDINFGSSWDTDGQLVIRARDPVPFTLVSLVYDFELEEDEEPRRR